MNPYQIVFKKTRYLVFSLLVFAWIFIIGCTNSGSEKEASSFKPKKLVIPDKIWKVADSNDYNNPQSTYSFSRFREGTHLAIFWDKEYGDDPSLNPDVSKRFSADSLMSEGEGIVDFFINDLRFLEKGKSGIDSTKLLMFVFGGDENTAFGSGKDSIGMLWTPATRVHKQPYGVLAHELGHSFQYLVSADGHWGFKGEGGSFAEMTSQWMLWQYYPNWITFENYHLEAFLDQTYLSFLHEDNRYHSPFVLEYWSNKHGQPVIGKLWRQSKKGEDPVMTYKRLTKIDQKQFNDEIFDASRRFVTWDMPRIKNVSQQYINLHTTSFDEVENGWLQIATLEAPQNYGYNAFALKVPENEKEIKLSFSGIVGNSDFRKIHPEKAGWRYGFLAVLSDGTTIFDKMHSKSQNQISFTVPEKTRNLWFVVSGAPTEHWKHENDGDVSNDEQWPYKIKLTNTSLIDHPNE